jgi:DNA-directed RNA polymerase subunit RPC12/RpoP
MSTKNYLKEKWRRHYERRWLVIFCPACGSKNLEKDLNWGKGTHRHCLNCGRRWIIIEDTFNDFGE